MVALPTTLIALITLSGLAGPGPGPAGGAAPFPGGGTRTVSGPVSRTAPDPMQGPEWWREARPRLSEYDRAYRSGYADGLKDAQDGRRVALDRQMRRGSGEFRRGYADGYRAAYRSRGSEVRRPNRPEARDRDRERGAGHRDPALAQGLAEGFRQGFDDGRDRDRYDPVRHKDYRRADDGYFPGYGPKDAYRDSYREGYRQGYESGYRDGARASRR